MRRPDCVGSKHVGNLTLMLRRTITLRRNLATFSNHQPYVVFDRNLKRIQRDRAAVKNNGVDSRTVDYLRNEVADRMIERLLVFISHYI